MGSPSEAPATTGFVVLMPTPHWKGLAICECETVAYQLPVPAVIAGDDTRVRALELQVRHDARVLRAVGEIRLFSRHEVAEVRLHRGDVGLLLRVRELRNRDRGKNADDDHDDQKFDEGEAFAVVHLRLPGSEW